MDYNKVRNYYYLIFFLVSIFILLYQYNKLSSIQEENANLKSNLNSTELKYEKAFKEFESVDSLLSLSLKAKVENVYVTNKYIYEQEKQVVANLSDVDTDSAFSTTLQEGYKRYGYLLKKE